MKDHLAKGLAASTIFNDGLTPNSDSNPARGRGKFLLDFET